MLKAAGKCKDVIGVRYVQVKRIYKRIGKHSTCCAGSCLAPWSDGSGFRQSSHSNCQSSEGNYYSRPIAKVVGGTTRSRNRRVDLRDGEMRYRYDRIWEATQAQRYF